MLNLTQLRIGLREGLGLEGNDTESLPDADTVDKTGADTYLNRSFWEIQDKFKFREKEVIATFATAQGENFYELPAPFEALQHVAIEDFDSDQHSPLDRMSADEFEQTYANLESNEDKPTHYLREKNGLRVYPTPDRAYPITIRYLRTLADFSVSNTTSQLPQAYDEIILFGAIWRALIGVNGDYNKAQAAKANQIALINSATPTEEKEQIDSHRSGVEVLGYSGEL